MIRRTLEYDAARIGAPVVAVDPAGGLTRVVPLGEGCEDVLTACPRRPMALLAAVGRQGPARGPGRACNERESGQELIERGGAAREVQARKPEHVLDRSQQPVVVVERR